MTRESLQAKAERTEKIITGLRRAYPTAHCELKYQSPLELLIATILSAQATDRGVNAVTPHLFAKYRTAQDYASARPEDIEQIIHSLGFFPTKPKRDELLPRTHCASRWRSPAHDGRVSAVARRRPQDRQCCAWQRIRD